MFSGPNHNSNNNKDDKENKSIFRSPFLMQNSSASIPSLAPAKRHSGSPIKRSHKRSKSQILFNDFDIHSNSNCNSNSRIRQPLSILSGSSNKSFSLLDDFQHGDINEPIDILFPPSLPPPATDPQNKLPFNVSLDPRQITRTGGDDKNASRSIFSFGPTKDQDRDNASGSSFVSMFPSVVSSTVFDFGSYLRSVTSGLQMGPKLTTPIDHGNNYASRYNLDFSNLTKYDLSQETDKMAIDELELDCVVRASSWDSDLETEDELDLELHLEEENSTESETLDIANTDPSSSVIVNQEEKQDRSAVNNEKQQPYENDYLKYFNQSKTSKSNKAAAALPSQIPSLYDPFHKALSGNSRSPSPPELQGSSIPLKIYSDSDTLSSAHQVRSELSSPGSEDTLNEGKDLLRQAKRLRFHETSKCLPHHHIFADHLKPALKPIPRHLLNLVVESSDGSLEDATKYATEINSQNSEGIPIPEKTTELVNIPTTAPGEDGVRKSAIIRGIRARSGNGSKGSNISARSSDIPKPKGVNFDTSRVDIHVDDNNTSVFGTNSREKRAIFNTLTERREALLNESRNRQNIRANVYVDNNNNFKGFYSLHEKQQFYKRNIANNKGCELMSEDKENSVGSDTQSMSNFSSAFKRPRFASAGTTNSSSSSINVNVNVADVSGKKSVNWAESLEW